MKYIFIIYLSDWLDANVILNKLIKLILFKFITK